MQKRLLIFTLFLFSFSFGQNVPVESKPKVGLVLSGGGAKGLAHIGALKVIEEAGVQIDYIGGTSMGAIVGALYASGYTAHQLDSIFRTTDFANLIQDNLPRDTKSFYEREDAERYALSLPFNNFKVAFPSAISSGQHIYNELAKLLYHVKDVSDFSQLPIPFFCIATDVETGDEVLINKGYLPETIMASGTFPSLFEPLEIDNRVLIDGGVVNNYPVMKVKEMGADIIIGVDVQDNLAKRENLMSATEVLLQINNYRTVKEMEEKSKQTDIYIKPNIQEYSVIDFDLGEEIIKTGEIAANKELKALEGLAILQKGYLNSKPLVKVQDSLTINKLIVFGNEHHTRGYIKGKLRFNLDKKIAFNKLHQGLNNLAASDNFKTIRYQLKSEENGLSLLLKLQENTDKTFIRMGAHYDDLYKSAAIINLKKKELLMNDDVVSFDLILGDNIRYNFQYYVDKGLYWSFGLNSNYNDFRTEVDYSVIQSNFDVPLDDNIRNINLTVNDITNQLYLQTLWKEEFAFTLGAEHKFLKYRSRTLSETLNDNAMLTQFGTRDRSIFEKSTYFSTYGQLKLDTYDDKYFPTKGLFFDGDFHFYMFSSDYNDNFKEFSIAKSRMGTAFPLAKKLTINIEAEGGFKLGTSSVAALDFMLGGFGNDLINNFIPFYGYDFLSLPGNSYVKAYTRLDYEFAKKNHLLVAANYANVADDLFRTGEWFTAPNFSGYAIGYGLESFVGPVQVLYSWSPERNNSNFFVSVGFWF